MDCVLSHQVVLRNTHLLSDSTHGFVVCTICVIHQNLACESKEVCELWAMACNQDITIYALFRKSSIASRYGDRRSLTYIVPCYIARMSQSAVCSEPQQAKLSVAITRLVMYIHCVLAFVLPSIHAGLPSQFTEQFVNPEALGVQMFRLTGAS